VMPDTDRCSFCHRSFEVTEKVNALSNKPQEDNIAGNWNAL
jgi:hypothetical protein